MGLGDWYDQHILPRLIVGAGSAAQIMKRRAMVVPRAHGDVFELGCGGGINLQYYDPRTVSSLSGIDPHGGLLDMARATAAKQGLTADLREGVGEEIPFRDGSFDCIVCTFTLCSVEDHPQVLRELRRVMKFGGCAFFLEHGRAPDPDVARWQERVEPVWKRFAGGCKLTRPIGAAFRGSGFEVEPLGQGYLPGTPRVVGWNEWGVARKAGL